jgi:alkylated DNA nucleotide flippase Atl1
MARTAIDKRDHAPPAKVEVLTEPKGPGYPPGRMVIATPLEIDAIVRRIPRGRVLTMDALRASLAGNHKADYACPLTTGIFLRIVAEASEEERVAAGARLAPYWRVVRDDGTVLDKLPGGPEAMARLLSADGVDVLALGKLPRVVHVETLAWTPPPLGKAAGKPPAGKRKPR